MTAKTCARLLRILLLVLAVAALPGAAAAAPHDVHLEAGLKAFTAEHYLRAAEELTLALEAHPTAKAALYLGNAYLNLGQLGKAKEVLERVLVLDPTSNRRELILKLVQGIASEEDGGRPEANRYHRIPVSRRLVREGWSFRGPGQLAKSLLPGPFHGERKFSGPLIGHLGP